LKSRREASAWRDAARRGAGWGAAAALLGSLALELQLLRLMELQPLFGDLLRIWRYFLLYFGLPLGLFCLALELAAQLVRGRRRVPGRVAAGAALGLCAFAIVAPARVLARRPFSPHDGTIHLEALVVLVVSLLLGWLVARFLVRPRRGGPWWGAPPLLALLLALGAWSSRLPEARGDRAEIEAQLQPTGRRVLLLGVDGATWKVIDPMLERDQLPNLQRLVTEGARATLHSTVSPIQPLTNSASGGMRSPVLWSTVITGREAKDHGILDMEVTFVPGLKEPLPFRLPLHSDALSYMPSNAAMRRVQSLWQIYSEYGLEVGSVAWWPSWPIEDVNGFVVSDRYRGGHEAADRVVPADLVERYSLPELAADFSVGNIFVPCEGEQIADSFVPPKVEKLFEFDNLAMVLGPRVAEQEEWDFLSIYVKGPDVVQHHFWEFHDPQLSSGMRLIEVGLDPVEAVYRHVDDMLGSLLAALDENTDLILISDHGAGPWEEEHGWILDLWTKGKSRADWSGNHRIDGIMLLWGPDIRPGTLIEQPVHLVDAAPTALYLMGFPIARDMPGRPLLEAIDAAQVARRPPASIASYETEAQRSSFAVDPDLDASIEAELRSLGYLN